MLVPTNNNSGDPQATQSHHDATGSSGTSESTPRGRSLAATPSWTSPTVKLIARTGGKNTRVPLVPTGPSGWARTRSHRLWMKLYSLPWPSRP